MVNLEEIYAQYLKREQLINREKYKDLKDYFSASSAGSCFRKQYLRKAGVDEIPMEDRVMRLLRLGTIVHTDIQNSLKEHFISPDLKTDIQIFIEHKIEIPDLNVIGHLDVSLYNVNEQKLKIYDIKTCASYKWRMKFGRNPDKKGSPNYNLQLGTYSFGLGEELKTTDIEMSLMWYNKDTSALREEPISTDWISAAIDYWEEANEFTANISSKNGEELVPGSYGTPMMNWECRYCGYKDIHCPGI